MMIDSWFPSRQLRSVWPFRAAALLAVGALGACATAADPETVPPGVMRTSLPPVPAVSGPISLYVEYPDSLQRVGARDSNFVFGTIGTGDATLIIDGEFVEVEPNGAFLAWIPVTPPSIISSLDGARKWIR